MASSAETAPQGVPLRIALYVLAALAAGAALFVEPALDGAVRRGAINPKWLFLPIDDEGVHFDEKRTIPYEPFMGTMGVAPAIEAVNALTPDYYGGNMDCVETCPGNEVWFPVLVEGAHFFTGDAHASQGDGEVTGVALEIPAKVTLTF